MSFRAWMAVAVAGWMGGVSAMGETGVAGEGGGRPFRLWAFGDSHVGTDIKRGRESLADALRQSEADFEWDIAIDVGDTSGGQWVPDDAEGREVIRQYGVLKTHRREQIYNICGNHDRSHLNEPEAWWFRKWIDPLGENAAFSGVDASRRPYPVEGTWERYSFRVGNILFLMMSDINEPSQAVGRGELGGNPAGVVRAETFEWWKRMVEENRDCLIVSAHHYMLKDTTTASGEWEGMQQAEGGKWKSGYHGYKPQGAPRGASYLYFVGGVADAQAFERYLEANPGAIALWLGGHTHARTPLDRAGGKGLIETRWDVHFANVCPLTRHHVVLPTTPMSRLLTFREGVAEVRIQCYLHTDEFAPRGWYEPVEVVLPLPRAFRWTREPADGRDG